MELRATPVIGPVVFSLLITSRKGAKNVTLSTSSKSEVVLGLLVNKLVITWVIGYLGYWLLGLLVTGY